MMQMMTDMSAYNTSDTAEIEALEKEVFGNEMEQAPRAPVNMKAYLEGDEKEQGVVDKILERISNAVMPGAQAMGSGAPRESEVITKGSKLTQKNLKPKGKMDPQAEFEKNFPQSQQSNSSSLTPGEEEAVEEQQASQKLLEDFGRTFGATDGLKDDEDVGVATSIQGYYEDVLQYRKDHRFFDQPNDERYKKYLSKFDNVDPKQAAIEMALDDWESPMAEELYKKITGKDYYGK
jgi:hypothetical protein